MTFVTRKFQKDEKIGAKMNGKRKKGGMLSLRKPTTTARGRSRRGEADTNPLCG